MGIFVMVDKKIKKIDFCKEVEPSKFNRIYIKIEKVGSLFE